jgi:hypothetical protein
MKHIEKVFGEQDLIHKYLIAEARGGLMEMPEFTYHNPETIIAHSKEEAIKIYNKKNNCNYFYGTCLGELIK